MLFRDTSNLFRVVDEYGDPKQTIYAYFMCQIITSSFEDVRDTFPII